MASSLAELLDEFFKIGQLASEAIASAVILLLAIVIGWAVYIVFRRYFTRWVKSTKTKLDDEILRNIRAPILFLAILAGVYYGLGSLSILKPYSELLTAIF